jgi:hypothetical protein
MAGGLLPPLERPETWWLPSVLYPLRGAEGMAMVVVLATAFWVFTVLVPEYCLSVMDDAERMGTPSMGHLVALISALPAVMLAPFALFYWLQYLARVLIASALGETVPPRTPDRNFGGFLNGLSPWFLWLLLGVSVGLLPLVCHGLYVGQDGPRDRFVDLGLLAIGLPYAVMALMMTFLHDDALAAKPSGVIGAMLRLVGSFWSVCVLVAAALGLVAGALAVSLGLRENHFPLYIAARLACWVLAQWVSIVVMRVLGNYYYRHREVLKWHRDRPRWGVTWKL